MNKIVFSGLEEYSPEDLFRRLPSPSYVIDETQLECNGFCLLAVAERTGCKVLLAQKAFSNYNFYPLLEPYLAGTEASGLYEARLGKEEMGGKEVHVFCAAYREDEFDELLEYADHIVFNSPGQLKKLGERAKAQGKSIGLRVNPECSTQDGHDIYDPCAPGSRLGTTREQWNQEMTEDLISLLDGIHFHTLCEQNADALEVTMRAVEDKFGDILPRMKWVNLGGGHHITRHDYERSRLEELLLSIKKKWDVQVYLEPGEAVALNAGYLVSRVLDIVKNGETQIAILDASAACHMPDVLEMPYRPPLRGGYEPGEKTYTYRLSSMTCLAGDVIGDYSFEHPVAIGDRLVFEDMAIYSMVKNNTFNGMPLPGIALLKEDGTVEMIKTFGYEDFKERLS